LQIAVINHDALEIYLPIDHDIFAADVRAFVHIALEDGLVRLVLDRVYIGNLPIDPWVLKSTVEVALQKAAQAFNIEVGKYAVIFSVELLDGQIKFEGSL